MLQLGQELKLNKKQNKTRTASETAATTEKLYVSLAHCNLFSMNFEGVVHFHHVRERFSIFNYPKIGN